MKNRPRKMTPSEENFEPLSHEARDGHPRLFKPWKEDLKGSQRRALFKKGVRSSLSGQKAKLDLWGGEHRFLKTEEQGVVSSSIPASALKQRVRRESSLVWINSLRFRERQRR